MKKILIFGTDEVTDRTVKDTFIDMRSLSKYGIEGFIEVEKRRSDFLGLPVFSLRDIKKLQFDKLVIALNGNYQRLHDMLAYGYGLGDDRVVEPEYLIYIKIIEDFKDGKYNYLQDPEIEQTVRQLEAADKFDIWCGYCPKPEEKYVISWDIDHHVPYVMFAGKKMYLPRDQYYDVENGKQYFSGLEFEQQEGSPHTYITDDIYIKEGDVVVDAGACEGNFAIKYIDKISKLYLIECSPIWIDMLKLTFRDYMDKIVFCPKYLGNVDDEETITLDSLVGDERVDFIKMDIEGAEIDALKGAENVFRNNNIRCSICSYHKHNDERHIRNILKSYGYTTSTSHGHMIFPCDNEKFLWSELRHGIVYGKKEEVNEVE